MGAHMISQGVSSRETSVAQAALKRPVSGMPPHVPRQVRFGDKVHGAETALERSHTRVDQLMVA